MSLETQQNQLIKDALLLIGTEVSGDRLFQEILGNFNTQWGALEQTAQSDQARKEDRDAAKRQIEALAKGLPAFASGLRDAVKGFSSGDPFAGSAAIMDVCATLSSTIGALVSTAGGPPGALVGALFSIVSMILKMFVAPQKSLTKQLEDIIRNVTAETRVQDLVAAQGAIRAFITTVATPGLKWTVPEYEAKLNVIDGLSINAIRSGAGWLREGANQDQPLWGQVLAAQCQAYILLKHSLTVAIDNLDDGSAKAISVLKLTAMYQSNDDDQLSFLQEMRAVARHRGTMWHLGILSAPGRWGDTGDLCVRDSPKAAWTKLGGEQRVFTVTRPKTANASDPYPYLAIFALEPAEFDNGPTPRNRKNNRAYGRFGKWPLDRPTEWREFPELKGCNDICAVPGLNERQVLIYTARDGKIDRWVHGGDYSDPEGRKVEHSDGVTFPIPPDLALDSVCAVSQPQGITPEDRASLSRISWVVYGGCACGGKRLISAHFEKSVSGVFFSSRGEMTGMKVDSKYLWVFTDKFISCISHAAVKACLTRKDSYPMWMVYDLPAKFAGTHRYGHRYEGLVDLAPCDDGTLVAVFSDLRSQRMYQAVPRFDPVKGTISVDVTKQGQYGPPVTSDGWTEMPDGQAHRVLKQPIFCWSAVEGLITTLQRSVLDRHLINLGGV